MSDFNRAMIFKLQLGESRGNEFSPPSHSVSTQTPISVVLVRAGLWCLAAGQTQGGSGRRERVLPSAPTDPGSEMHQHPRAASPFPAPALPEPELQLGRPQGKEIPTSRSQNKTQTALGALPSQAMAATGNSKNAGL